MKALDQHSELPGKITSGKVKLPHLILIYGKDGVGKSTFAASMGSTLFIGPEDGTAELDVARWNIKTLPDAHEALDWVLNATHSYTTIAIDSVDWLEPVVWEYVCKKHDWENIESPGYGKGHVAAQVEWARLRDKLSLIRDTKKLNVVLIGHALTKTFQDPQSNAAYDRFQVKLNEKTASMLREFVDSVLFATYDVFVKVEKGKTKAKAYGDGARVMYTEYRPAFDAKNRFRLPFQLPLSFEEYEKAIAEKSGERPEAIISSIKDLMKELPEGTRANVEKKLIEFKDDKERLLILKNKVVTATERV